MSEDLTYEGDDDDAPEKIREDVTLAGADTDVPEDIEERVKRERDDDELDA